MAGVQAVRAGAAYVELYVRDNRLVAGLNAAVRRLKAFGASIAGIGARLGAVGALVTAPLLGFVRTFASVGDALDKAAARTGLSVEALSELGFAAEQSGADLETLEVGIRSMQRAIASGLAGPGLAGMTPEEQFLTLAERISRVEDPTQRAALAMQVFGKSGQRLIPLLASGAKGIAALRREARALGLSISTEQAKDAAAFTDAWNRLTRTIKAAVFALGGALAPTITDLLGQLMPAAVSVGQWARQNSRLVITIAAVAAGVVAAGIAIIGLGAVLSAAGTILGTVTAAISLAGTVLGALLSPVGLVVAAIVGLGIAWLTMSDRGKQATAAVREALRGMAVEFGEVWSGIVAAVQAGDLELALEIVAASMRRIWAGAILAIREGWNELIRGIVKSLKDNPWILPLAGGVAGWTVGGPWGAAAGVAGGIGLTIFADDIAEALTVEVSDAAAKLRAAKDDLTRLINRSRGLPPRTVPLLTSHYPTPEELRASLTGARGAFATPFAAGQLGLDDRIKRQEELLDDLVGEVKQIKDIVRGGLMFQ
jgi:hypothetical protein